MHAKVPETALFFSSGGSQPSACPKKKDSTATSAPTSAPTEDVAMEEEEGEDEEDEPAYITSYLTHFEGKLKFTEDGLTFDGTYTQRDGDFVRGSMGVNASISQLVFGMSEALGLGQPQILLEVLAAPEERKKPHYWMIEFLPNEDPDAIMPHFQVYRDGEKYVFIPYFLEFLKEKAEKICSDITQTKCTIGNFTAGRYVWVC